MKTMKAIAALCAAVMAFSTMALPVQAKTSKAETEVITMDDNTTVTKPKTKKSTKKSKSSQVSWKNAGKPLQCTVKTERDFYKAMSNAIRLNAPSLKVTLDKSYKGRGLFGDDGLLRVYDYRYVLDLDMGEYNYMGRNQECNADKSVVTFKFSYEDEHYGNAFCYAYNTGDTANISDKYADMYEIFSGAADNCTETTDLGKAEYVWNWVIDNMVYDDVYALSHRFKDSFNNPTADGKYKGCCEDYTEAYVLLMRMLSVPCWETRVYVMNDPVGNTDWGSGVSHAVACAKINGEYRYFDPTLGKTKSVGLKTFNMTTTEMQKYYEPYVRRFEGTTDKSPRRLQVSELEQYFIW